MNSLVWLICLCGAAQVPAPTASKDAADAIRGEFRRLLENERVKLAALADQLETDGRVDAAKRVRVQIPPPPPFVGTRRFVPLAEVAGNNGGLASIPANAPERPALALRLETAEALFDLANRSAAREVSRFGLADACLRAVLDRNPDHAESRRLLGYVRYQEGWATAHAAEQLKQGKRLHPTYGWVPDSWVPHLDLGELPASAIGRDRATKWLPAAEADVLRTDFERDPWAITTHHFEIRTNVPLNEAISFGKKLEAFYDLFFATMADVIGRERLPLAQRFANPKLVAKSGGKRHQVWYFADRQEYLDYLRNHFQRDESISLGFYMPPAEARASRADPRGYFYRDEKHRIDVTSTLFHEASHQLLFESAGPTRYDRNVGGFWVWEGLGTYFETVRLNDDGSLTIGGVVGPRMDEARKRLVERGEMIPIAEFVAMGRARFQAEEAIYLHYAQAMALAVCLMHGRSEIHRDAFLDYVRAAYDGRLGPQRNFESMLGASPSSLGDELLEYLRTSS